MNKFALVIITLLLLVLLPSDTKSQVNASRLPINVERLANTTISVNSGTNDAGTQRVTLATNDAAIAALQLMDDDQTGASVHYRTSGGATEDKHEIKGSAGRLFSVTLTNTNAAVRFIRCYNLTSANTTVGTSTVFLGHAIPGDATGAGITYNYGPTGIAFSTALTCSFTTGVADSDVAEVAANEIKAVYAYK